MQTFFNVECILGGGIYRSTSIRYTVSDGHNRIVFLDSSVSSGLGMSQTSLYAGIKFDTTVSLEIIMPNMVDFGDALEVDLIFQKEGNKLTVVLLY